MASYDFHRLALQLVSEHEGEKAAALRLLYELDEAAVDPLTDVFYGGVSEAVGRAIIGVLAEIGGPDALLTLRDIYHYEERTALRRDAARGLLHNRHALSPGEVAALLTYLNP